MDLTLLLFWSLRKVFVGGTIAEMSHSKSFQLWTLDLDLDCDNNVVFHANLYSLRDILILFRLLGLCPLLLAIVLFYCWLVVRCTSVLSDSLPRLTFSLNRSHFIKQGKLDKVTNKSCCPIQLKTGVQISGGETFLQF